MKRVFQWMGALALMVMCTCAFVACSDDDDNNSSDGSWTAAKNAKILGTWVITSVTSTDPNFDPFMPGPAMGQTISFYSNGTFAQGDESGTFKYNNETGAFAFTSQHMSTKGTALVSADGESMEGTIAVTFDGATVNYVVTFEKTASSGDEGGDEGGDDDWSEGVQDNRIVGSWIVATDGLVPSDQGKTITFASNGTFSIGSTSGTYTTETEQGSGRIRFELYVGGTKVNEGKFVLVSNGNVLNGEYREASGGNYNALVLKKSGYTYPSGDVQGRWKVSNNYMGDGPSVGSIIVFDNGQMYVEGDPHYDDYAYSNNSLAIYMDEGTMTFKVSFSQSQPRVIVTDNDDNILLVLTKP